VILHSWQRRLRVRGFHERTIRLMGLHDEALALGWDNRICFTYRVAELAGELGGEVPSENAIRIAEGLVEAAREE
jgi:hypothetical protein